jgi:SAM-dependent methyltransferase
MEHIYTFAKFGEAWFSYPKLYASWVKQFSNGAKIVEVGCWKGRSTAFLAVEIINSKKDIKLYAVDTWLGSEEHKNDPYVKTNTLYDLFIDNMKPFMEVITPMRMTSLEASKTFEDQSLDAVFIDACHSYECVLEDIKAWLPKVKNGGYLAGHDWHDEGVQRAVRDSGLKNIQTDEDCFICKKE